MNVLVDTSVWINHFRAKNAALIDLVTLGRAITHPMVLIELACGTLPAPRDRTLRDIAVLATAHQTTAAEVRKFIEQEKLFGLGCGLVDVSLLSAVLITPNAKLWTLDKRLADVARRFGVQYAPTMH